MFRVLSSSLSVTFAAAALVGGLVVTGCSTSSETPVSSTPTPEMSALQKAAQGGAVVIDVRSKGEWDAGHVAESTLLPLPEVEAKLSELQVAKDAHVILVCRSGNRAGRAKAMFEKAGFTHVENGGSWKALCVSGDATAGSNGCSVKSAPAAPAAK